MAVLELVSCERGSWPEFGQMLGGRFDEHRWHAPLPGSRRWSMGLVDGDATPRPAPLPR
jgi:hypothetical protein